MIKEFKNWAYNNSYKPSKYEVLKQFVDGVKDGDLVACAVCGEYNNEEHMSQARFDYYEVVCPDCRRDGN